LSPSDCSKLRLDLTPHSLVIGALNGSLLDDNQIDISLVDLHEPNRKLRCRRPEGWAITGLPRTRGAHNHNHSDANLHKTKGIAPSAGNLNRLELDWFSL
jgi:hypothetical protein